MLDAESMEWIEQELDDDDLFAAPDSPSFQREEVIMSTAMKRFAAVLCFHVVGVNAIAETYHVALSGSDDHSGGENAPWATFAHAMTRLHRGDILVIHDGTYLESLNVTASGEQESPIVIKALHDGQAVVDGRNVNTPLIIDGRKTPSGSLHDIVVEGMVLRNSDRSVAEVGAVERVVLKRISAYNAAPGNNVVYSIWLAKHVLLEDCVASGSGRQMYNFYECELITMRRCYGRYQRHSGFGTGSDGFCQIYGSSHCIVENCVGTRDPGAKRPSRGATVWANVDQQADSNLLCGNIMYGWQWEQGHDAAGFTISSANRRIEGNRFIDNAVIECRTGFFSRGGANTQVTRMTIAHSQQACLIEPRTPAEVDDDYEVSCVFKDSVLLHARTGVRVTGGNPRATRLEHRSNNLFHVTTRYQGTLPGAGDTPNDPKFDPATYGRGAYLKRPRAPRGPGQTGGDVGAEILYRYVDGKLTDAPLWPWPMEERICDETGMSVTWEESTRSCGAPTPSSRARTR